MLNNITWKYIPWKINFIVVNLSHQITIKHEKYNSFRGK